MFYINMSDYKRQVLGNEKYFSDLDGCLQEYAKAISLMSKKFNKGKVLDGFEKYGSQSVHGILETILATIPEGLDRDVVLWYVSFDFNFWKKVKKNTVDDLFRKFKSVKPQNEWESVTTGFYMKYNGGGEGYSLSENHNFSVNRRKIKPIEVILDAKRDLHKYEDAMLYMKDNLKIFPKSVRDEFKEIGDSKAKGVRRLKDVFQQQVYLSTLPGEYSVEFLKGEIKRLTVKDHLNGPSFMVTTSLLLDGFLQKYGEGIMYQKEFSEQVFVNLVRKHNANDEVKSFITKRLYRAMRFAVLNNMGLALTREEEIELCMEKGDKNENTVGA